MDTYTTSGDIHHRQTITYCILLSYIDKPGQYETFYTSIIQVIMIIVGPIAAGW